MHKVTVQGFQTKRIWPRGGESSDETQCDEGRVHNAPYMIMEVHIYINRHPQITSNYVTRLIEQ